MILEFLRKKNYCFWLSTIKNFTVWRFSKLLKNPVVDYVIFRLALFIQCFTAWKKKDMSNQDGVMKNIMIEEVPEDDTTSSHLPEVTPLSSFEHSTTTFLTGETEKMENVRQVVSEQECNAYLLKELSDINKKVKRYDSNPVSETVISKWLAFPLASLLPKDRREEWLGDLYESQQEMINKKYPNWFINIVDILRVIVLIASGLKIKLSDFISFR